MPAPELLPRVAVLGERDLLGRRLIRDRRGVEVALREALKAHGRALLWDVEGILHNRPRLDLVKAFEGRGLWVNAGVRSAEAAIDVLVAGAERVVLDAATLGGLGELGRAADLTESLVLCIDNEAPRHPLDPTVRVMGTRELLEAARAVGIGTAIVLEPRRPALDRFAEARGAKVDLFVGPFAAGEVAALEGFRGGIIDWGEGAWWRS